MPKYVIEREIPGVGKSTTEDLKAISMKSCDVIKGMNNSVQWMHSYVTGDKIYCVYYSPNEEKVREHAEKGGFPANKISQVYDIIDPASAE